MTIKPVETMPQPPYPDKYSVEAAKVVQAARPRRWLTVPLASGVLTASILLGMSGCGQVFVTSGEPLQTPTPIEAAPDATPMPSEFVIMGDMPVPTPIQFGRIPLFEFGEGAGSIGCVAIAAPVFLSEDDAFAILSAVFEEAGLALDRAPETLCAVNRPVADLYSLKKKDMQTVCESLDSDGTLKLGGGIPMIFVSADDLNSWQRIAKDGEIVAWSSVSSYDVKSAAKALAENNDDLLVFYDPIAPNSEELLRQQAEAFLQWLRAEGII